MTAAIKRDDYLIKKKKKVKMIKMGTWNRSINGKGTEKIKA